MTDTEKNLLNGYDLMKPYVVAVRNGKLEYLNHAAAALPGNPGIGANASRLLGDAIIARAERAASPLYSFCRFCEQDCALEIYPGEICLFVITPEKASFEGQISITALKNLSVTLRDSVSGIMRTLELFRREAESSPKFKETFYLLEHNLFLTMRPLNNLYDLILFYDGTIPFHPEWQDAAELCTEVAAAAGKILSGLGITLRTDIRPEHIEGLFDRQKLERMLLNLISNAAKSMPNGGEITLKATKSSSELILTVGDKGGGADISKLARMFSNDWILNAVHAPENGGLGLLLVKQIADLHNGRVLFESRQGEGTTVTVTLPLTADQTTFVRQTKIGYDYTGGFPHVLFELSGLISSERFFALRSERQ